MSTANLLCSLLFGSIGLGYFVYGRRQSDMIVRYTGVALMVYPYFIANTVFLVLVGAALMLLPKFITV